MLLLEGQVTATYFQDALSFGYVSFVVGHFPAFFLRKVLDQAWVQDFGQGGLSGVLTPRGPPAQNVLKIGVFPIKIARKLHDFEEILWPRGGAGPPRSTTVVTSTLAAYLAHTQP